MLRKQPGTSVLMVITLALGIGANVAIFSVVDSVLLKPLPFFDPDRLALVWSRLPGSNVARDSMSLPNLRDLQQQSDIFEALGGMAYPFVAGLETAGGEPAELRLASLSPGFFSVLGISPMLGREFSLQDIQPTTAGTIRQLIGTPIVLSHRLWSSHFGSTRDILGRTLRVDGRPMTVVGVMPEDFRFFRLLKEAQLGVTEELDAWVPLNINNLNWPRDYRTIRVVGRLEPALTLSQANQQAAVLAAQLRERYASLEKSGFEYEIVSLSRDVVNRVRPALVALLGAVGLVLLVACANVCNLLLMRAVSRRREISVRAALGAGRAWIVRQLLSEGLLISFLGGLLGMLVARWGIDLLLRLEPGRLPRIEEVSIDFRVLLFALLVAFTSTLLFGIWPALQLSQKLDLRSVLNEGGRGNFQAGGGLVPRALGVVQMALSLVLLVSAVLMVRSFLHLREVSPGFVPENTLTFNISLPAASYASQAQRIGFYLRLEEELERRSEIEAAGGVLQLPLSGGWWTGPLWIPGESSEADRPKFSVDYRIITPGYFAGVGSRMLEGRSFRREEYLGTRPVAILDSLALKAAFPNLAPGESVIGKTVQILPERVPPHPAPVSLQVVGVVEHARHDHPGFDSRPTIFFPPGFTSFTTFLDFVVRGRPGSELLPNVEEALWTLDPSLPVGRVSSLERAVEKATASDRFTLSLIASFAGIALILALVGLYGIIAFGVSSRTREIGIRLALGARPAQILTHVFRECLLLALLGSSIGLLGAFLLQNVLTRFLYGISPLDPLTLISVPLFLMVASLLACWKPAWRATGTDPVQALREG